MERGVVVPVKELRVTSLEGIPTFEKIEQVVKQEQHGILYSNFPLQMSVEDIKQFSESDKQLFTLEERYSIQTTRVNRFKEITQMQQSGFAEIVLTLFNDLDENPDISLDKQLDVVMERAYELRMDDEIIASFYDAIETYQKKHSTVKSYEKTFTPQEIYQRAFNRTPQGNVDLRTGPMTLYLIPEEHSDYINGILSRNHKAPKHISDEEYNHANSSGAIAFSHVADPQLEGILAMENGSGKYSESTSKGFQFHEELHQFSNLFTPEDLAPLPDDIMKVLANTWLSKEEVVDRLVKDYYKMQRNVLGIEDDARGEIIAYYGMGVNSLNLVNSVCSKPLYDYQNIYKEQIERIPELLENAFGRYQAKHSFAPEQFPLTRTDITLKDLRTYDLEEVTNDTFGLHHTSNYYQTVSKWVDAIERLEEKNYAPVEILAHLFVTPTSQWSRMSLRAPEK